MATSYSQLADPTEYGYQPGDGPLRPGGVPGSIERDSNRPSTRSARSAMQQGPLQLVRDMWAGTDRVRHAGQLYLPRAPGEGWANYQNRLRRSAFFNAFRRTVEGLAGLVFRRDIRLGEDVPPQIQQHWENIDNAGTHGDVFCRELFEDDLIAGHTAILVEFPNTQGMQDAGEEMLGEIRPYWVPIRKEDIISWRTKLIDGRQVLMQLVLRECTYVDEGKYGEKERERYRVFSIMEIGGMMMPVVQVFEEVDNAVVEIVELRGTYPTQERIPVIEVPSSGRKSLFVSDPPLKDLAFLNVAHYQMWSDYNWSIHKTCVPFIFGAGIPEATDPNTGEKRKFEVGANSALITSDPNAKMSYISHSGDSLESVKAALDDLKNDMGSLGIAMLAPQKRAAETAEAKRLDKSTSDSALAVSARGLQDALEAALELHARYLNLDAGGSIEVNRDFEGLLMEAPVMQAYSQFAAAGFPKRSILEALQAGGRIGQDEDLDELEMEWMVGDAASAQNAIEDMSDGAQ